MGLKSGSRDAGLDESEDDGERPDDQKSEASNTEETESTDSSPTEAEETGEAEESEEAEKAGEDEEETDPETEPESASQRPTMDSIPYKLRREKVNEGREQVPYFLREEVVEAEDELQDTLEELLGENVYKSDYREASMVVAQRNPELIAEVLREWGYDLDAV